MEQIVAINLKAKNKNIVKRVIGLHGDKTEHTDKKLFINNQIEIDDFSLKDLYGIDRIPEGKVFVFSTFPRLRFLVSLAVMNWDSASSAPSIL
ncbi:S26 family signal peptidase [Bacillus cereus]|uniref:S26 family signal peptidase n=1 Tax=Bacillus cereus TaxID=1396 RepID=UPI0011560487|nr:S26 family signal peptidase [Bacillus cereus]